MNGRKRILFFGSLAIVAIACDLNPQPLPPLGPDNDNQATDDGFGSDAGFSATPEDRGTDAGVGAATGDAAPPTPIQDGGDPTGGGDGGDAGDAAPADAGDGG